MSNTTMLNASSGKRKAEIRTIIAISRQSSRSAPKVTKEELQWRHEQNNQRMKTEFLSQNVDWSDAEYLHHELLVMPSNVNVALHQERTPTQIRSDIKDRSAIGPVMILTSQADGWTTNTEGLSKLFRDYATTENVTMFVDRPQGSLQFEASQYLEALKAYMNGSETKEELDDLLEYIHVQIEAGKAKQQYVHYFLKTRVDDLIFLECQRRISRTLPLPAMSRPPATAH